MVSGESEAPFGANHSEDEALPGMTGLCFKPKPLDPFADGIVFL